MAYLAPSRLGAVSVGLALLALCAAGACSKHEAPSGDRPTTATSAQGLQPVDGSQLLPWGAAPVGLAWRPLQPNRLAEGPDAVAVQPDGRTVLLDRLAGRVVRIEEQGKLATLASVPVDTQDLAASADGSLVVFSPLHARATVLEPDGAPAGELAVPRALPLLQSLSLGPSHRLRAQLAYQQTVELGSPAVPMTLGASLHTLRDGAFYLPDGRGLQCSVRGGQGELRVLTKPASSDDKPVIAARLPIEGHVTAARLIGLEGAMACLRIESVSSTPEAPALDVLRRAVCLAVPSGEVVLDEPLGRPGPYLPRTELAMGGGRLAFILPTAEGLELRTWSLRARAAVAEVTP